MNHPWLRKGEGAGAGGEGGDARGEAKKKIESHNQRLQALKDEVCFDLFLLFLLPSFFSFLFFSILFFSFLFFSFLFFSFLFFSFLFFFFFFSFFFR